MDLSLPGPHILSSADGDRSTPGTSNLSRDTGRSGRLRELDGWRAISVLLVVLAHASSQHLRFVGFISRIPGAFGFIRFCGPLGVKTFFVISGFVICRLLIAEEARTGRISLKAFYYRRIFRILPPLYLYLGVLCLLFFFGLIHEHWKSILYAALFLRDVHIGAQTWFSGHTWSLAVEEQFYLTFPAALVMTPRRWRNRVFLGAFLACGMWNFSLVFSGWDSFISTDIRTGFACISFGVLMALHNERARRIANAVPWLVVALVAITLALHPVGMRTWKMAVYESLFVPPAIGILLLFSLDRGPWLRALLCSKPLQAIGITSYGIYLWQELFTGVMQNYSSAGQVIPRLLPLLFVVVPLSYILIEKPAMHYGKLLSSRTIENSLPAVSAGA